MPEPTLLVKGNLIATEWSPTQGELDQYRPIDYIMNFFAKFLPTNYRGASPIPSSIADRILILESRTGSGKSTLLPPEFYHRFFDVTKKNIACTQPRVLTSVEIPKTIIPYHSREFLDKAGYNNRQELKLGENIGYQTKIISKRPIKGLVYMTVGILLQQLAVMTDEEFMERYSAIFIDEVHERSIGNDISLCLMKKFIQKNYKQKDCPFLIVMSATFDTKKFCDYLLSDVESPKRYKNIIKVGGSAFPIKQHFLKYDSQNYIQSALDKVIEIHTSNKEDFEQLHRDILIFVAGISDVGKLKRGVHGLNKKNKFFQEYPALPLELSSEVVANQTSDYKNAVSKKIEELHVEVWADKKIEIKKPFRRVIIGTNVAETGITISTLKYIIDTGYHKSNEFNPNFAVELLITKPITLGMYKQRIGRVGRTAPGESHALYREDILTKMVPDQYPDVLRNDISLDLLQLIIKELDVNIIKVRDCFRRVDGQLTDFEKTIRAKNIDIYRFDMLDLPSADGFHYAMEKLYVLGMIDKNSIPTATGFLTSKLRGINIESAKMILSGYAWKAPVIDLVNIAAFLHYGQVYWARDADEEYSAAVKLGMYSLFDFEQNMPSYSQEKTHLFLMDDFIAFGLIFREFQKKLSSIKLHQFEQLNIKEKKPKLTILEDIESWCAKYGLSFAGLTKIIETREEIISSLAMMGLDPYAYADKSIGNLSSLEEKREYIQSMKLCIFEGYKMNIAIWNPYEKRYFSRKSHLPLKINSSYLSSYHDVIKYGDDNPKYIIYDRIMYLPNPKNNIYESNVSNISVLDGYITLDVNFDAIV